MPTARHKVPTADQSPAGKPAAKRNLSRFSLASCASAALDIEAIHEVIRRLSHLSLRTVTSPQLNAGYADLHRAGVRVDTARAIPGKALLGQIQAERERRDARVTHYPSRAVVRQAVAPGAYTATVNEVSADYRPKPYSTYA